MNTPNDRSIGNAATHRREAALRFCIVAGLLTVILATAFLLLIFRPPANRPPEIRLRRLTLHENSTTDFLSNLDGSAWLATRKWVATFEINNPGRQAIGFEFNQVADDFVVVSRDGERTAPFADFSLPVGGSFFINHDETKPLLGVPIPPESKICRFRIVYWPMTARECWGMSCTKWKLVMRYPTVFSWVSAHLPDKRRTLEAVCEVPLPCEPEVLTDVDER
jgi:hypothetical protein